jgi:hypothetical protein
VTGQGRIVHVSKSHPGSVNNFTPYKQEAPAARGKRAYADSGSG